MAPIELEMGFQPRQQWHWAPVDNEKPARERLTREEAQAWAQRHKEAWEFAKANTKKAQDRQRTQANKHRRPVDWDVGDLVFVSTDGWKNSRGYRRQGPFRVLEKVGHSWKVDMPSHWKGHDVFNPERLRKWTSKPLPGQEDPPEPADDVDGEPEWTVSEVLDSRVTRSGRLEYQVTWQGWDPDDTWYPARNLKNSTARLREFHERRPEKPGPPKRLQAWVEAAADDRIDEDHDEDDLPMEAPTTRGPPRRRTIRAMRA
jgi:hypothetical protein